MSERIERLKKRVEDVFNFILDPFAYDLNRVRKADNDDKQILLEVLAILSEFDKLKERIKKFEADYVDEAKLDAELETEIKKMEDEAGPLVDVPVKKWVPTGEEVQDLLDDVCHGCKSLTAEVETQKAEIEKLREALEDIVLITKIPLGEDYSDMFQQSVQYARQALELTK